MRKHILITDELRYGIKLSAAMNGKTIRRTVEDSLTDYLKYRNANNGAEAVEDLKYSIGGKRYMEISLDDDLHNAIRTFVALRRSETDIQQFITDALVWKLSEEEL